MTEKKLNKWKISTFVILIIFVFVTATSGCGLNFITGSMVAEDAIEYINTEILQAGMQAEITGDVTEEGGLYKIPVEINGAPQFLYVSKTGEYLVQPLVELKKVEETTNPPVNTPTDVPKTDKPVLDLYVMSQCPYGTQAEEITLPVVELFGDSVEFNLRFIANDNGDGTFRSLHGQPEVDGDIRQLCVEKNYPEKYFNYLLCVAEDYSNLDTIWGACAEANGMDASVILDCFNNEGSDLLSENVIYADENGVGGSPTFFLNGVKISPARTQDGIKTAVCSGFNNAPGICDEVLDNTQGTAAGSC